MRIEELENNLYIKSTDTVEKYLLNIIQEYFRDSNEALEGSREYIIREAVDRLRTEMDYNSLGVLSITLPSGKVLKGDVSISLEDLDGEPLIDPKLSAFNVNFGNIANTACEGNDPRLYDARKPIQHEHEISDIRGLEGVLSTILSQINRNDIYNHNHNNKPLLDILVYTGDSTSIDLSIIDTLEPMINHAIDTITENIRSYITTTQESIDNLNEQMVVINQRIDEMHQYVIEKCEEYLRLAKQYTDEKIETATIELKTFIEENYVNKEDVQALIDIANKCYTLVNTEKWKISDLILSNYNDLTEINLTLSQDTLDEFMRRSINIGSTNEVVFEFFIEYKNNNDLKIRQPLPYLDRVNDNLNPYMFPLLNKYNINTYIQMIQRNDNVLKVDIKNFDSFSAEFISKIYLVCDIYAKDFCPVLY